jgi:hypothetical protein
MRLRIFLLLLPVVISCAAVSGGFAATRSSSLQPLPRWLPPAEANTLHRVFGDAKPVRTWYAFYPRKIGVTFVFNRVVTCGACSAPSSASLPRGRAIRLNYDRRTHSPGDAIMFCESKGSYPPLSACLKH